MFKHPIVIAIDFMTEINTTRQDVESVYHPRSKEDSLPRVVTRISRELSLGQLKYRLPLIRKPQLFLNFAWSWIFFRQHQLAGALLEIVLLWLSIVAATVLFSRVSRLATWLMLPYLAWVTFAAVLNYEIWRLNPA